MFPFACVPLASRGVVSLVLSGLAHVRALEWSMACFVGRLRALASNGRQASFSQSPFALAASVLVLVSCVAYPLYGIVWLGRLVPPRPLFEVLGDSKATHAVRFSRLSQRLLRHACACCSLGYGVCCERGFCVPLCCSNSRLPGMTLAPAPVLFAVSVAVLVPGAKSLMDATWLILPVVICLSQRLSHACVSMN
jgi:hypothetical protein